LVSYSTVTELPGQRASEEQLRRLYHRYKFASTFCKGKDVLEVACGAGMGLGYLARVATKVVGGDIDKNNLRFAISHYEGKRNIEVRELDAHQLPYENKSFDVVILYEAIYYLAEPEKVLSESRRILRKGGVLLIATVNKDWSEFNPSPFSTSYFSVPELSASLQKIGFKVEMYGAFSVLPKGAKEKIVASIRKIAVALHLIPKTMKGKEFLKKIFYGKLKPLKGEVEEGSCDYSPPSLLPLDVPNHEYKVIYAVARI
jgi:ubiquinone/menaquinone biosynthesis C-methylase UbiE